MRKAPVNRTIADALLRPRSVAIVGASDDETKASARPLSFLRGSGFTGEVYAVNPQRRRVQGEPAWPTLSDLPVVPDHVYVLTNADAAIEAVRECGELGVPVATVLANGFAESGPAGAERQRRILTVARRGGVRILGPNSLGVVNLHNGLLLTGNAAFAEPEIRVGSLFLASQSGSAIGAFLSRGHAGGLGFAAMVSVGSEADISIGEICLATLDDPDISAYALFLEALSHIEELADFGRAAAEHGKPVVVYKLGRSHQTAALTVTHTGAISGSENESRAFLAACGFAIVDNFESLIETPALVQKLPPRLERYEPRIGLITSTGGGAAVIMDELTVRGCSVTQPSPSTFAALAAAGCPVEQNVIVDLTLAGTRRDLVRHAVQILQGSGEFDLVLFVLGSSARFNPELAVSAVIECADGPTPLAAFALPEAPGALAALRAAGVPAFRTPESCAAGVQAAFARRPPGVRARYPGAQLGDDHGQVLDEAASAKVARAQGIPVVANVVLEGDCVVDPAQPIDLPFGYPVAVKALTEHLLHKSDAGGVMLDIADETGLRAAMAHISQSVASYDPAIGLNRFLVQPMMAPGIADVLLGYRISPLVGPTVILAVGGVHAELYSDSALRLAPVDPEEASRMIDEVRGLRVLQGFRGRDAGDVEGLVAALTAMSELIEGRPDVLEAEINPLRVGPKGGGVIALDALVRLRTSDTTDA
jgi:acetate---CoA ligase (ADP-forming)